VIPGEDNQFQVVPSYLIETNKSLLKYCQGRSSCNISTAIWPAGFDVVRSWLAGWKGWITTYRAIATAINLHKSGPHRTKN